MKMIFPKLLTFSFIALLIVSSCKKDEVQVVASANPTPGALTASATTLVLAKENATKPAVAFNFTSPDFGFDAAVTNTLQLAVKGNNFANPKEVPFNTGILSKEYTVIDFNAFLLAMNLKTGVNSQVEARLKSQITGTQIAPIYSPVVMLTVTPYALTSFLYVPGAYQGWTPATADSLLSATSNGVYKGVINYTPGNLGFKILTKKSWGPPEYGKGSADGTIAIGGSDLSAPAAESYELVADINANTLVYNKLVWGIIGNAPAGSNWSNDIDMKYDNGKQTWSATVNMGVGAFKFRRNHDWAVNFGFSTAGTLGGTDIPITEAGNYKVVLDLVNNKYTLTKL